ncbi:cytochrome P450 [Marinihelvus fidelis]|uniref:Cytochrome P450 n=1 Tax=Marinihelvus fidelis TaxID=2613842 RepID=A0A5N0TGA6_9GAMM|nr:cytochrome P450 [Marinihelvus fidelis]KAA9133508.1 cytochrome P450 [Marinihelvus fidelis]
MNGQLPESVPLAGLDLRARTDELRPEHAVVRNARGEWVLLRHAEVLAAALDDERFSSGASRFLQIPNGLNGETHSRYRNIVDRYLSREALTPFISIFEQVAEQLVATLPRRNTLCAVTDIGMPFGVRAQCAWLGWPGELECDLLAWIRENFAVARSADPARAAAVAERFDGIIRSVIAPRRAPGAPHSDDVTTRLCREQVNGRSLTDEELVSILRNWTGGDLGSIALSVGVLLEFLGRHPALMRQLRSATGARVDAVIDEILRLDDPFVSNRRVTTCPVRIGGHEIPEGATVRLNWTSANRDERVFDHNCFDPEGHAAANLVFGAGRHVCPGRLLATWELRILARSLLSAVQSLYLADDLPPERETAPLGGYRRVPVVIT